MSYEIAETNTGATVKNGLQLEKNLINMFCADKAHMQTCIAAGLRPQHFSGKVTSQLFEACIKLDDQVNIFDTLLLADEVSVSNTINVLKTPGNFVPSTSQPRVSCLALLPSKPEALHAATRRLSHDTESIERRRVSQRHCC